jgi:hypothetical protein
MSEPRRINLRVDEELYTLLDDKRHAERTTFQDVGLGFFRAWLKGESAPTHGNMPELSPSERRIVKRVLSVLRSGNRDAIAGVESALKIGELLVQHLPQKEREKP